MSSDYIPGNGMPDTATEMAPHEPTVESPSSSPAILMIATPPPAKPRFGSLFWLAHLIGLDIYGPATLSYAARVDMNAAALVLASIFIFDLAAWCLLFYFIVNSGSIEFSAGRIIFAIGGIVPAMALFLYERSFMTADTKSRGWGRLLLPTAIRLAVILGAAWITAQPVEMLTFGQRIKDRVQQELIRKNIVGYYRDMKDAQAKQGNAAGAGPELVELAEKDRNKAQTHLDEVRKQHDETTIKLNNATIRKKSADEELRVLISNRANSKEDPNSDPAMKVAKAKRDKFNAEVSQLANELKQLEAAQQHAQDDLKDAEKRLPEVIARKKADITQEGLDNWVQILRALPPGQDKTGFEGDKLYEFKFVDYDFLDKFRIIDDVLSGRPPRWPGADQQMIADLKKQYGMYDLNDAGINIQLNNNSADVKDKTTQGVAIDPAAQERSRAEIRNAKRMYWAIFGVAVIIPLLSLLFKLIMPSHLSHYYSSEWQAQQGNPWAIAMEAGIASMEDYRADRKIARSSNNRDRRPKRNRNFPSDWSQ